MKTTKKNIVKRKIGAKPHFQYNLIAYTLSVIVLLLIAINPNGGAFAQNATTDITVSTDNTASTTKKIAPPITIEDISLWTPASGDRLEINVETNTAQLIHENGDALQFEIVSGVRRFVYYIGHRYFAATPAETWIIHGSVVKKDRITFGKTGRFFRLYEVKTENGKEIEESTPYGIHGFGRENSMFSSPGRYGSMGCVIIREEMLDTIQKTIDANGGSLKVITFPDIPQDNQKII